MFDASIALTLVVATGVATLFHRIGLPAILGFMLTGAFVGPSGFGVLNDMHAIEEMAEIGLVFLLFMVGLELSPDKLKAMRGVALKAGSLYMIFGTVLLGLGILAMNVPPLLAFILGGVLTISSTALVVKSLEDAKQMGNIVGGVSLGTLIVQDIVVIPLLLLVPLTHTVYATAGDISWMTVGIDLGKAFAVLAATVILSLFIVPRLVDKLAHARSRELFTLSVFSLGIGMAYLTHLLGLSMEAGAFVGGLALSGSVYSKQVLSDSRPFRDVFAALFFVSLGAMLDARFLVANLGEILGVLLTVSAIKFFGGVAAMKAARLSWKTAIIGSLALFQVGELAFMVLRSLDTTLRDVPWVGSWFDSWMAIFVHAIVLSMFLTPLLSRTLFGKLGDAITRWVDPIDHKDLIATPEINRSVEDRGDIPRPKEALIVGYGPIAQQVSEACNAQGIPYHVIETNPSTVKELRAQGIHAVYGDASSPEVLKSARLSQMDVFVVTVPDSRATQEIVYAARCLNPDIHIIARARFTPDVEKLKMAGASEVIHDEQETGDRFVSHSLMTLGLSESKADEACEDLR